ncbi:ImmA/IrrE family metallo-endopeptidase [Pseudonocardiaceae bacterium YIM PH 21723]|nr:ImmA/IrrE family metallo-endopeptidase [Pseudonocardiaceae bacterium YIM PH 21723]
MTGVGERVSALRKRIDDELDALGWAAPYDIDDLLDRIADRAGKPIGLLAAPLPADGAGGLVIHRAGDIVIIFDESLPSLQQEHVILHEAAHVLFDHRGTTLDELTDDTLSELDPEVVQDASRFAKRDGYSALEEQMAEVAAALMWLRIGGARSMVPVPVAPPEIAAVNDRFAAALTHRRPRR